MGRYAPGDNFGVVGLQRRTMGGIGQCISLRCHEMPQKSRIVCFRGQLGCCRSLDEDHGQCMPTNLSKQSASLQRTPSSQWAGGLIDSSHGEVEA
jgi:hypothetical protein